MVIALSVLARMKSTRSWRFAHVGRTVFVAGRQGTEFVPRSFAAPRHPSYLHLTDGRVSVTCEGAAIYQQSVLLMLGVR
jgi:hypothetical protein